MYTVDALQSNQTVQQIESTAPKVLLKFLNGYLKDDKK